MKNTVYKRAMVLFSVFCMLFSICAVRIYLIQKGRYASVADMQFSREIILGETRGSIYDVNMRPMVNEITEQQYIVMSDSSTRHLTEDEHIKEIKQGLFIRLDSADDIDEGKYVKSFQKITRYSDKILCSHIIGYTNSSGRGVAGIEKAFDKILTDASGKLSVSFNADAANEIIRGDGINIQNNNYNSKAGIRLTIDKDIQKIAENALSNSSIECGGVVVLDVETAEIRAISSVPCYDINNLEASLSDKNLPFLNRALCAYPVGSVFKPIIASAALENGYQLSEIYDCQGSILLNQNVFSCYNNNAHGKADLNYAFETSCNTFFINMGLKTGKQNIYNTAQLFGFGNRIELCSTLISESGKLPSSEELVSQSDIANLCFGQGSLLATPLQIAAAYNVFANNGIYTEPILLKELIDDTGKGYAYYKSEDTHRVINSDNCKVINDCLYNNMLNGTGSKGKPDNVTSAGKTATAQTGRYDDSGKEVLCTWFAGYFPFENPQYTVVIFNEDGTFASEDCAPVFKEIAENIADIKIQPSY